MADGQERTEQPTGKRLSDARQKGNVAKSMEVNSALGFLAGLALIYVTGNMLYGRLLWFYQSVFSGGYTVELTPSSIYDYILQGLAFFGVVVAIFMFGIFLVGIAASIAQVGFLFTLHPLKPKFDKLNPFKGMKKLMFSTRALEETIKNFIKLFVIVWIAYSSLMGYRDEFIPLQDKSIEQIASFMVMAALKISLKIGLIFLFIAAADYAYQRYEYIKNLKMTKQEVKDESKQQEGNPQVKSKIRSLQLKMLMNRMMQAVPQADVVITNPTHYAVALKYDAGKMMAPRVVAKGQNLIALKIKQIAEENSVPIVEDPPLARALYKSVDVNQEIPETFFQAVAEVLAYVYKMKNRAV